MIRTARRLIAVAVIAISALTVAQTSTAHVTSQAGIAPIVRPTIVDSPDGIAPIVRPT